uniref:Uncharacterized protein n=1 Tax=Rhizophora mucronata TaxID=61149 RepID=A0A2P2ITA4_RHIMU
MNILSFHSFLEWSQSILISTTLIFWKCLMTAYISNGAKYWVY